MASVIQRNFRVRKSFAKLNKVIDIPNLIDIQKRSYDKFLQTDIPTEQREDIGLQGVFKSVFPIKDFAETSSLEYVSYNLERPKYDVDECRARGMTFAAPVKVIIRLVVWDVNEETGLQSIRDVKEQEVYFGEIPLMTIAVPSSLTVRSALLFRSFTDLPVFSSTTIVARLTHRENCSTAHE